MWEVELGKPSQDQQLPEVGYKQISPKVIRTEFPLVTCVFPDTTWQGFGAPEQAHLTLQQDLLMV